MAHDFKNIRFDTFNVSIKHDLSLYAFCSRKIFKDQMGKSGKKKNYKTLLKILSIKKNFIQRSLSVNMNFFLSKYKYNKNKNINIIKRKPL